MKIDVKREKAIPIYGQYSLSTSVDKQGQRDMEITTSLACEMSATRTDEQCF